MAKRVVKKKLPCVVVHELAVLPGMVIHFDLNRPKSVKAVQKSMLKDHKIFVVSAKEVNQDEDRTDICDYGSICYIKQVIKMPNNVLRVLVEGDARALVVGVEEDEEANYALVKECAESNDWYLGEMPRPAVAPEDEQSEDLRLTIVEMTARIAVLRDTLAEYLKYNPKIAKTLIKHFDESELLSSLIDGIAMNIPMDYQNRQRILELADVRERTEELLLILQRDLNVLKVKNELTKQIKERVDKNQRQYVLREQLKVIKEELGDKKGDDEEEEFRGKVAKLKASKEVKEHILKEIDRYSRMNDSSSESDVTRGYIETLLALPWDKESKDCKDIDKAERILNEDHYGLEKVKERIIEFLAVRNLTSKGDSPIICLVGPPGTGKTSIAQSVAKALDKKYVRICLGGVRDEAELRGHRKTYIGAMPGRVVSALKTAGVKNPVILLDEIDKMSSDYKGDPASAMLEVLDPEQNSKFSDHYVGIPVDLSKALFIATANSASNIPRPLLDRMEIIEVNSYTENEKIHIAKDYLVEKQIKRNGLTVDQLTFADTVWPQIVSAYTKEAGVRGLERVIAGICRKSARKIYQDGKKSVKITKANLEDYLGKPKYSRESANEQNAVGIVRGLAWTSVGGDTLSIEVNVMPGKGEMILTGQMGDVMKESAAIAMSYVRSVARQAGVKDDFFKKNDFHLHIPEGSVPKDGPSAGITMTTAFYSAATGKEVYADLAMTGEVTLRGRVLPIGGLKEKILAAKNAGIKRVLVPVKNKKDIDEIDDEIKSGLKIIFVENMDEVIAQAIVD